MARWRLSNPHYINVPGTEWEHKETTNAGKAFRKMFVVPMYLDPRDPADHNYPGEIVVCYAGKGQLKDIVFEGDPTPEMIPLDTEAEEISASFAGKWKHPIEQLNTDFSQSLITMFEGQMQKLLEAQAKPSTPIANVSVGDFEALKAEVAKLMARNAELEAASQTIERRV